jgi:hypothetical protein
MIDVDATPSLTTSLVEMMRLLDRDTIRPVDPFGACRRLADELPGWARPMVEQHAMRRALRSVWWVGGRFEQC